MTASLDGIGASVAAARSLLFVPGDRPDRFAKAAASGADLVVLDLEDAVAPERKATAREFVRDWLAGGRAALVRINAHGTPWYEDDLAMAQDAGAPLMVPKAEDPERLAGHRTVQVPLIETALGVLRARELCAVPGVVRPAFGSIDLAAQLAVNPADREALHHARATLVLAAAAASVAPPVDGVTTAVNDTEAARDDTVYAARLGFSGKLCVHPGQVAVVHEALAPTPGEVRWAREVVEAAAGNTVAVLGGNMIDKPVVDRARRLLVRAGDRSRTEPAAPTTP
ncbi:HpcH/HpaI aldolase/citrate lyase family protein [Streptomyces sp. NPDC056660]|uniref:HpcH/HpaI aldolase/citrate lyase family protein n=1 Tax=Streptomyces sp. NPDC056660 TaxID=3345897 RepID=UPI0036C5987B